MQLRYHYKNLKLSKWIIRPDPARLNPTHFLASQKNSKPARPITGWRVKRVGSQVHLIKKNYFFSVKIKL